MTTIKNIKPLTAEELFDLLKKEFADYMNSKLDSNLTIDYAHVYDQAVQALRCQNSYIYH